MVDADFARAMGECADEWEAGGGTVPGPFFAALARVRQQGQTGKNKPQNENYQVLEGVYV